jgi:transcriptional antiterminator RfaH
MTSISEPIFANVHGDPIERGQMYNSVDPHPTGTGEKEAAWYCLQAKHKHEHIAAARLRELRGVTVFCPRIRFRRQCRNRVTWVTEPLFPGYLFARFELGRMYRVIDCARGIRNIVRFGTRYPTIDEATMSELEDYVGDQEVKVMDYQPSPGDYVKIGEGPFVGLEAVVVSILPARARVRVLMEFLGRKIETEVEPGNILEQIAQIDSEVKTLRQSGLRASPACR